MAWRVTQEDVRELIETDTELNLAPFIDTATALTDYVSGQDTLSVLTTALLKEIEKYLAAHFYEHRDQMYSSKKTGDANAKFQGEWGMGLDSSKWGQTAKMLDITGTLTALSKGVKRVGLAWLGLPHSEQTAYEDRD